MPNQYKRVNLTLAPDKKEDSEFLSKQYTKAIVNVLKNKIPQSTAFVDELIRSIKEKP